MNERGPNSAALFACRDRSLLVAVPVAVLIIRADRILRLEKDLRILFGDRQETRILLGLCCHAGGMRLAVVSAVWVPIRSVPLVLLNEDGSILQ
jgi:hypothetical protein